MLLLSSVNINCTMDYTSQFYSRPSYVGSGFPVFTGARRQRGGGIFGSLSKVLAPVAKRVGRSIFRQGIGFAKDVASDVMAGKDFKSSLINRGKSRAKNLGREALRGVRGMVGQGRRRYRKRTSRKRLSRKRRSRSRKHKTPSRKRRRSSKSAHRKQPAKRRRVASNY